MIFAITTGNPAISAKEVLNRLTAHFGGRGGGDDTYAQGKFNRDLSVEEITKFLEEEVKDPASPKATTG